MSREWMKEVNQSIRELKQRTHNLVARPRAGGGKSRGGIVGYEVDFVEDLPERPGMPRKCFAWVNENNGLYMRNPANNGWVCLNRFE